jgi:hypothetical protein
MGNYLRLDSRSTVKVLLVQGLSYALDRRRILKAAA